MKYQELIERYIYAVTRRMPGNARRDVAKELESIISDMLDERCEGRAPTEQDVRIILSQLGTPNELYAKYDPNANKYLIGPEYFSKYIFVLKIVGISVLGAIALAMGIVSIINNTPFVLSFLQMLSCSVAGLFIGFAIVTIVFVVFEWRHIKLDDFSSDDTIDNLPPVPKHGEGEKKPSVGEAVVGIIMSVLFTLFLLTCTDYIAIYFTDGTPPIPIFNSAAIRGAWVILLGMMLLSVARELISIVERGYTPRLFAVTLVTEVLSVGLAILFFLPNNLLAPELLSRLDSVFTGAASFMNYFFADLGYIILGIIIVCTVIDIISLTVKTVKAKVGQ